MSDGWGESASGGWGSPDDGWGSGPSPAGSGPGSGFDAGPSPYAPSALVIPKPVSVAPLVVAVVFGVVGIALSFLATPTNPVPPVVGWLLCTFGDVLAVAFYQRRDLERAFESMYYRPAPAASVLRWVALGLAAVGIVANSLAFAHWMATR